MKRKSALELIEKEIKGEIANALGRTGEKLISAIKEVERLERELALIEPHDEDADARRARLIAKHEETRTRAEDHRLNLMIQREAIGVREHRIVYATYPIPPKYAPK